MTTGSSRRLLLIIVALAIATFSAAALTTNLAFDSVLSRQAHVKRELLTGIAERNAFMALLDEESGVRGFVDGDDRVSLERYRAGRRAYAAYRAQPRRDDDPAVLAGLRAFDAAGDALQTYFGGQVTAVLAGRTQRAVAASPHGERLFERLRHADALAVQALRTSLQADYTGAQASVFLGRAVTLLDAFVLVFGVAFSIVLILRIRTSSATARSDALTRLGNRLGFEERLAAVLAARTGDDMVGVLYLDLDRFKPVNDKFGHQAGDEVLAACGARLRNAVRPGDFVARVGGDEFAAILVRIGSRDAAQTVAARTVRALEEPLSIAGTIIRLGASVGVAIAPHDGIGAVELVRGADESMFADKRMRRQAG